jgi:cystathionine gamma-synthase
MSGVYHQATGAIVPPIYLSTTFERAADGDYSRSSSYSREDNPNRRLLGQRLAALEGGKEAPAFRSGMAASAAIPHSANAIISVCDGTAMCPASSTRGP